MFTVETLKTDKSVGSKFHAFTISILSKPYYRNKLMKRLKPWGGFKLAQQ